MPNVDGLWHVVKQGEWLTKIAALYHVVDGKKQIWGHPNNQDLALRRDPNVLHPGDRLFIPAPLTREQACDTDQTHEFILRAVEDEFRVRLLDDNDSPIGHAAYVLWIGNQNFKGETDDKGEIHVKGVFPSGDHRGVLQLPDQGVQFVIGVGDLNPARETSQQDHRRYDNGISGVLMRLRNLGYGPEIIDEDSISTERDLSPEAAAAILAFQDRAMGLTGDKLTGELDSDTRKAIQDRHGS